jgi:ABC-type ATPase with predicted acetyltransferase domain
MLAPLTIHYPIRPTRRSLATGQVADLFGLSDREPPHAICENLALDLRPGDVALFIGPSGSGKSSLLREVAKQVNAIDVNSRSLPDVPLVDALTGPLESRLELLSATGLAEARLMLRTPSELSDGQRYRFRIAFALEQCKSVLDFIPHSEFRTPHLLLDEFTAPLDRPLAKVVAFNLRKLATRTGVGVLAATTHDDVIDDLNPDLLVRCHGEGEITVERKDERERVKKKRITFHDDLWLSDGTVADWPYFARWHYRDHRLRFVRRVMLLWHGKQPVGICVFAAPLKSLALRTRYFGLTNPRGRVALAALNDQLWLLQRVVLHPTYRGAGLGAAFVKRACELCPVPWIETLSAMGQVNPVFERAGFVRVGTIRGKKTTHAFCEPVYFVRDNRKIEMELF